MNLKLGLNFVSSLLIIAICQLEFKPSESLLESLLLCHQNSLSLKTGQEEVQNFGRNKCRTDYRMLSFNVYHMQANTIQRYSKSVTVKFSSSLKGSTWLYATFMACADCHGHSLESSCQILRSAAFWDEKQVVSLPMKWDSEQEEYQFGKSEMGLNFQLHEGK